MMLSLCLSYWNQRRERLQWTQDHVTGTMQQWSVVLFTDECWVTVHRNDGVAEEKVFWVQSGTEETPPAVLCALVQMLWDDSHPHLWSLSGFSYTNWMMTKSAKSFSTIFSVSCRGEVSGGQLLVPSTTIYHDRAALRLSRSEFRNRPRFGHGWRPLTHFEWSFQSLWWDLWGKYSHTSSLCPC